MPALKLRQRNCGYARQVQKHDSLRLCTRAPERLLPLSPLISPTRPKAVRGPMPLFHTAVPNKYLKQQDSVRMVVIFGLVEHVPVQAA